MFIATSYNCDSKTISTFRHETRRGVLALLRDEYSPNDFLRWFIACLHARRNGGIMIYEE